MTETKRLLAAYVENGSEAAFRELVSRYADLVYSVAVRLVAGDSHLAQDVAQNVFIDLARLAGTLSKEVMLGGWLHRHTCFVASKTLRAEGRRRLRERQAAEMNALQNPSGTNMAEIGPVIDEAIDQLGEEDRAAIVLRFFEQRNFRSVGEVLGSTEDTAQKRVSRALEKLHSLLKRRDIAFSSAALGTVLAAEAVTAAPAGLAANMATVALAGGSTAATTLGLAKVITMTKIKLGLISAIVVVGVATPLWIQRQSEFKLHEENQSLRLQLERLAQTAADNERLSNLLVQAKSSAPEQFSELLRLRGEVGGLKRELADSVKRESDRASGRQQPPGPDRMQQLMAQKEMAVAKMDYMQKWMVAFMQYAYRNQGQFPTNFDVATSLLSQEAVSQTNFGPDQFEIVYHGSVNNITDRQSVIVMREKEPWQAMAGGWVRGYSFADGHVEIHKVEDGNFQDWESQHGIMPPAGVHPGQ
jgi:RNA polymerase sigma factor (sigma-70 family)